MRVVFLTHNYPRDSGDLAGAFLHPLALALRDRGHDVRVVAPSDAGQGGRSALDGVPVTRVRYASPGRERYAYTGRMQEAVTSPAGLLALRALHAALRRATRAEAAGAGGEVVVHAHWWLPGGLAAPPELPCVVTLHGTDARLIARHRVTALVARRVLRPPRVVTAVSWAVAELAAGALARPIDAEHVCPMPVTEAPRPSRGGKGIVFVGRLTDQKRLPLALEALGRLPAVTLTIVGDGPARPGLEAAARKAGLTDRVRFVGRVAPDQVAGYLEDADAFVFPAVAEGFGLAAIEALLAGVPVVACRDGGGVLDALAVDGAGVVVDPSAEALAGAIGSLIGSAAARESAHAAGLAWHARLTPAAVAARAEGWYREALRG
jgi:glycosyltransferase involved in cell wall biosynthesis